MEQINKSEISISDSLNLTHNQLNRTIPTLQARLPSQAEGLYLCVMRSSFVSLHHHLGLISDVKSNPIVRERCF